ncbi:response regulator receiver domain protein [Bacteroides pyogenes F0041]|uniref:Response regulator receiver domain protein n=1 Tax=Bacteroides pyogenes F0041 TaxID=1321819 RepID=U2CXL9_9BACE|nr:response regulator [Bacteroides pyogenes]ERI89295.1 response regulator receiver domain protein [Bacteroides pyogenes F0041]
MKKKILLIDDKPAIGKVVSVYLEDKYDLIYLENPLTAIEWLKQGNRPDLIILDLYMPHMPGKAFLKYLKESEPLASVPVVVLSSEEDATERIRLLEEGIADYILKPFDPLELKTRIKKVIE